MLNTIWCRNVPWSGTLSIKVVYCYCSTCLHLFIQPISVCCLWGKDLKKWCTISNHFKSLFLFNTVITIIYFISTGSGPFCYPSTTIITVDLTSFPTSLLPAQLETLSANWRVNEFQSLFLVVCAATHVPDSLHPMGVHSTHHPAVIKNEPC